MIYQILIAFLLCKVALCHPQSIRIPEIKNSAPPTEVNSLTEHKQYPRSIGTSPTTSSNKIEDTVKEVEAMLKANPTLPRLTRGEILDLIENITKADMANNQKQANEKNDVKERDPKAIMVVMPFTPSHESSNNMEELFTKPPVTHIVGTEPFEVKKTEDVSLRKESTGGVTIAETASNQQIQYNEEIPKVAPQRKKAPTTTSTMISIISTTSAPAEVNKPVEKITSHPRRRPQQQKSSTEPPVTTHRPRRRRPGRRRPTTTEKHPNHRYPDDEVTENPKQITSLPSDGIRIVQAPKFNPLFDDLIMTEDEPKNVYVKQDGSQTLRNEIPTEKSTTVLPLADLDLHRLKVPDTPSSLSPEVTTKAITKPMSTTKVPLTTEKPPAQSEEDKLKEMLASLGVLPVKPTTTTTAVPDISNVADNLSPEMRDLLMSFGLLPQEEPSTTTSRPVISDSFNPVKAEVKPESYLSFKPLPEDETSRQEMDELLARFGLGRNSRKRKSLPKKKEGMSFDAVPDQYKGVLENIGLMDRGGRMIRAEPLVKTEEKQHVFNPGDTQYASNEELEKLGKLLDFVKKLENLNRTVTDEDVQKADVDNLKELLAGLNKENLVPLDEQNAPNPINYGSGLEKNEVKRQENITTTTSNPKADAENITVVNQNTSSQESATPNLKDLEASFGGQVDASPATEPPEPETTPQSRRTGFYYLVDWNTFLDIDDQKGKRVNLRFQPTIGDPKRFLSVTVP